MQTKLTAWMLRRDGKAFPCECHYYGSMEDIEETLYAAEWLYKATESEKTRRKILELVAAYGASLSSHRNLVRSLLRAIKEKPYVFLSYAFVQNHADKLTIVAPEKLYELNADVIHRLNNEFLRVRLGGMYDTEPGNRNLYFRVSGDNFDWIPVIVNFARSHTNDADTITVLWDQESTGHNDFLIDQYGRIFNQTPLKEVLT